MRSDRAALDDRRIEQAVMRELIQARGIPVDDIDVDVSLGVVTLRGSVDSLLARERAVTIVQRLRDIRAVVDLIEVQPPAIPDATLEANVARALSWDPAIAPQTVSVSASDGVVTLRGTADSWAGKQLVATVAKAVQGVAAVQNEIQIRHDTARTDGEIRAEIERRLLWDARVGDGLIQVDVQGGYVTLSGVVGSAYERQLAMVDAWIPGVQEVDARGLEVSGSQQQARLGRHRLADITDEDIRGAVLASFRHDPRVAAFPIEVDVHDGMVTLSGLVDNLKAKRAATQGAANTAGVEQVIDLLRVRGGEVVENEQLAERVAQALGLDSYTSHHDIAVEAWNGTVTLYGDVESHFTRWHAGDVAARVAGVRRVSNRLGVDYAPLVYQVPFHDWDPLSNAYDPEPPYPGFQSDRAIRANIERALQWSPYVDPGDIVVVVDNGVATLTGTVPSREARGTAAGEAYQGGAQRVLDRLAVEEPTETPAGEQPQPRPPVEQPQPRPPVEQPQPQPPVEQPQPRPPVEQPQPRPPVEQPQPRPPVEQPPAEEPPIDEPQPPRPPVEEPQPRPPVDEPPAEEPPVDEPPAEEPPVDEPSLEPGAAR